MTRVQYRRLFAYLPLIIAFGALLAVAIQASQQAADAVKALNAPCPHQVGNHPSLACQLQVEHDGRIRDAQLAQAERKRLLAQTQDARALARREEQLLATLDALDVRPVPGHPGTFQIVIRPTPRASSGSKRGSSGDPSPSSSPRPSPRPSTSPSPSPSPSPQPSPSPSPTPCRVALPLGGCLIP